MTTTQNNKTVWVTDEFTGRRTDVRLRGSGLAVDLLAAALARGGLRVSVVSAGPAGTAPGGGPVGVNTVPYTAELLYLLADRFRVPEIASLAMFGRLPEWLQATSGVKQSLGFVYHRPRAAHDQLENVQFSVPGEHAEWHAYLPRVQQHTRAIAERYGARYLSGEVNEADEEIGLDLRCTSPHEAPAINATAYFEGILPFEEVRPPKDGGYTLPWSEGSTAHGFRGGWVHVASFGNHPAADTRGAAVTLRLAPDHPDAGADLDEVLDRLSARYPDLGLQLRGSVRAGRWTGSLGARRPNLPPEVGNLAGEGALALDLGHGDALFGQNLTMALELVHAAAAMLLSPGALAGPEAVSATAARLADFQRQLVTGNEWFAAAGLTATQSFSTWNAFVRAWLLWSISSALALKKVRIDAARSGNWSPVSMFDRGIGWFDLAPGIADTLIGSAQAIEELRTSGVPAPVAAGRVFRLLSQRRIIPPLYKFGRPAARRYQLDLPTRLKLMAWTFTLAPREYRGMLTADNITAIPDQEAEFKR
jgi:FADH2 O2-dependent halogenase